MNKIFKVIWNKNAHCFVVTSELAKSTIKSGRQKLAPKSQSISGLFSYSLLVSSLLVAISGTAYAANAEPTKDLLNQKYKAANGLISIAGGGEGDAFATDSNNEQNDEYSNDYGIAIGAGAKGFWASVAMGDTAEARSLYGTAIGPKATIDNDSNYAVSLGNNASVKTSNNGIVLGSNANLTASGDSVAIGNASSIKNSTNSVAIGNATSIDGAKNSVALGANSTATADDTVSIGSIGKERKLVNLAEGALSSSSTEAVNGSQLFKVDQQVQQFDSLISNNANNIDSLTNGSAGLIQLSKNKKTLLVGGAAGGTTKLDLGNRDLTGVNKGQVNDTSTDAVNGSQLHETREQIKEYGDNITANAANISTNAGNIATNTSNIDALNNGKAGLVQLNSDGTTMIVGDVAKDATAFDLAGRKVTGVTEGELAADSTDAVNGGQLFEIEKDLDGKIATNTNNISTNAGNIATNTSNIDALSSGKAGLVQLNSDGTTMIVGDVAKDAMIFDLAGRKVTGVTEGELAADSTDAVNGSQLHETREQIKEYGDITTANTENITANAGNIATNTTNIATNTSNIDALSSGKAGLVQLNSDGTSMIVGDVAKGATAFDLAGRKITGVTEGELAADSTDAVNGSQLHETREQIKEYGDNITANTNNISTNAGNIATNTSNIDALNSGKAGLVQLSSDGSTMIVGDVAKDATAFDLAGRKVTGVTEGELAADSTDAVNGSQLHETREQIKEYGDITTANTENISANAGNIATNTTNIDALNSGKAGLVQLSSDGTSMIVGDVAKDAMVFDLAGRKVTGVTEGELTADSTDAVNGSQLHETREQIKDFSGNITANTDNISTNAGNIATNTTNIATNTSNIDALNSGKAGLVQLSSDGSTMIVGDVAKDAMIFDLAGRTVTGIKEGKLSADSTDAINGAQLFKTNSNVQLNTENITSLSQNIADISVGKAGLVQLNEEGNLAFSDTAVDAKKFEVNRTLSGVTDGTIAADSTEAVNGSQLFLTNSDVKKNTGDINDLVTGKAGLVQLSGGNLIFGSAADSARVFNIGGRKISGVQAGELSSTSTEAVNGSQLHETNTRVDDLEKNISNGGNGAAGMLEMGEGGESLVISEAGKNAKTLDLGGDRTISGLKAGELSDTSTEAVNGSQLHATNQQVSKNTNDISKLSNDISSGKAGVAQIDGDKIVFNDGNKGTTTVDVGGRNIANIKNGAVTKDSKDAVNGSQLFETNTKVDLNTANIEINRTDINKNKTAIASNTSKITDLENSFSSMNSSFKNLSKEVNKNKKRADAGIAGAMAMTAIPFVHADDFSFGMALSGYRDQGALAAGMTFKTSEHTAMKIHSSWDTQNGTGIAAGFAWGW
ncbi:hypothetical protein GN242_18780 [Erwinia sorbitola]|uniref:Adhesin n=1 Tax=Erwinia sorbitola TaxID=2681984 RepID=A0A6I6EHB4_9GAMM|nr:hypothetical protein GN242_18780 [Erwinia sorbitola]